MFLICSWSFCLFVLATITPIPRWSLEALYISIYFKYLFLSWVFYFKISQNGKEIKISCQMFLACMIPTAHDLLLVLITINYFLCLVLILGQRLATTVHCPKNEFLLRNHFLVSHFILCSFSTRHWAFLTAEKLLTWKKGISSMYLKVDIFLSISANTSWNK